MINKKIFVSSLSIMTSLAMMGGATFAFFSDTATSSNNVFATGNLVLQLDDASETTPAETVSSSIGDSSLLPGDTVSGFISLHNGGTIDIAEVNLKSTESATSSPDLASKLSITSAKIGTESTCSTEDAENIATTLPATLAMLNSDLDGVDLPSSALPVIGGDKYLCLVLTLDSGTDDTYQGKSITELFTFTGHQDIDQ